ncbi:Peroxin-3 [Umbelopsis sp. PMI_123]|nr:Peroxin-3 [Umbelopsis sp. PMI_123]
MLKSIKDYTKRHRRGLLITATIIGGGIFAGQYARNKIQELQDKAASERMAKENLKRRFEQNQNDCTFTVLSLLPTLSEQVFEDMAVEELWGKLQQLRKEEKQKREKQQEKEKEITLTQEKTAADEEVKEENAGETQNNGENGEPVTTEQQPDEKKVDPVPVVSLSTKEDEQQNSEATSTGGVMENSFSSLANSSLSEGSEVVSSQTMEVPSQEKVTDQKSKYALWEEIKIKSFTRSLTSLYSLSLLTLLTHAELNLLGRFTYVSSIASLNRSEPTIRIERSGSESTDTFMDIDIEGKFLSFSWWLLHKGWKRLAERVEAAVQEVFGSMQLKHATNYEETLRLIKRVRHLIEYDVESKQPHSFAQYIMPQNGDDEAEVLVQAGYASSKQEARESLKNYKLRRLLDETTDFIESHDFKTVLGACLEELFAIFYHNTFTKPFDRLNTISNEERIQEINSNYLQPSSAEKKVTIANLLPPVSRQSHLIINSNEYLNALSYVKELQAFSAIIYTQYDVSQA